MQTTLTAITKYMNQVQEMAAICCEITASLAAVGSQISTRMSAVDRYRAGHAIPMWWTRCPVQRLQLVRMLWTLTTMSKGTCYSAQPVVHVNGPVGGQEGNLDM